jgi:two-component sensor histidine kinase
MLYETHTELQDALGYVCEALASQAEPRSISVALPCEDGCDGLGQGDITTVALVVNELATNAIKHAFQTGQDGHVTISANGDDRQLLVIVDDDGLPFPEASDGHGLGLELIRRLIASVDGVFIMPQSMTKRFEIRVPKADHGSAESSELADAAWDCR